MSFPDTPISQLLGSEGPVHTVSYSAYPGTYILTGSADRTIRLYNPLPANAPSQSNSIHKQSAPSSPPPPARLIQTYSGHGYPVLTLTVPSSNDRFASAGGDRLIFLWDVASATTIRRLGGTSSGHTGRVNCIAFGGSGDSVLVSGGFDTTVRLWDLKASANGKPMQVLEDAKDSVTSVSVYGHEIISASVDGKVRRYDIRMGRCVVDVIGSSVTSLDLTRDGNGILTTSLDGKVRLMDKERGSCLKSYEAPERINKDLRVQSVLGGREKYVLSGDELQNDQDEGIVWVWDLMTARIIKKLKVPWGPAGGKKKVLGSDGKPKDRKNIISCMAWQDNGWGNQFCVGGLSGIVTVYGQ